MSWEEEQERLTLEARLLASSPEAVFEELKKLGAEIRAQRLWTGDDKYEASLIGRNERLINLGLASYGTNKEVLKALYKHGLEPAQDASEASYKEGLRIGLLSNNTAHSAHLLYRFPDEIIGPEETRRVINEASINEVAALIQNPKVSDDLLTALYKRQGPFTDMPEERWGRLIHMSASNARLVTRHRSSGGPDFGHLDIHKSIFELLETAPANYGWLRTLYELLDHLDFQQVHSAERLDHVLERWAKLPISKEKDSYQEGHFTALHIREEFRCFVAALYGDGYAENKKVLHGDRDADDVALRCAYYAKGDLTAKDMKAGHTKDGAAFTFAAMLNSQVHYRPELRQLMEGYLGGHMAQRWLEDDEYVLGGGDMAQGWFKGRWLKYDEQLRKEWSWWVPSLSAELAVETATNDAIARQSSVTELQKALATLAMRLSELRQLVIVAAIILAILIYFRSK